MKTTEEARVPDAGDEELAGVSLRAYAAVYAGLAEGFELDEVLENEGIEAARWPAADRAWTDRLADDHEAAVRLPHPFDALMLEAQLEYTRKIPPLDEDPRAFFDFVRLWAEDPEPFARLETFGMRPNDVIRLQRLWGERAAADEALRKRIEEILMEDPGPMPEPKPEPAKLRPRRKPAAEKKAPEPVAAAAPPQEEPPIPSLSVPLPREEDAPAAPVAPPPPAVPAPSAWRPPREETTIAASPLLGVQLPFAPASAPADRPSPEPQPHFGLPFGGQEVPRGPVAFADHTTADMPSPFAPPREEEQEERFGTMAVRAEDLWKSALPFAEPPDARFAAWTSEQHAALCAELAVFAHDKEAVFTRYGLFDPADRDALDQHFKKKLADPAAYAEWQAHYYRLYEHFAKKSRR
jgi:hypothetical protein